jgi:radical SAM superfamily enzyme YgiQ (UPF0313 family)
VAAGYAELTFPQMIRDFEHGELRGIYTQPADLPLDQLPTPRYDLYEDEFTLRCFVQATRGCPFHCTYCALKGIDPTFRFRPVSHVVRDIEACEGKSWLQRKLVWFWDDNLTADRDYARALFQRLRPLKRWWSTQTSIDMARDRELVRMASRSGCLGVFIGLETFSARNLLDVKKGQNRVAEYRDAVRTFHDAGILVQAGIVVGLDDDSPETLRDIPDAIQEIGIDFPHFNLLTPFPGTPLRAALEQQGRLLDAPWSRHDAAHATFLPAKMSPSELEAVFWEVYRELYAPSRVAHRFAAGACTTKLPGFLINAYMDAMMSIQNLLSPDRPFDGDAVSAGWGGMIGGAAG